jgi:predicted RNA-binding Zn-ribbon protein involved in translation (DUF1610 family)
MAQPTMICSACQVPMEPRKTDFTYLGHSFYTDILRCPKCGQVFIPRTSPRAASPRWRCSWRTSR